MHMASISLFGRHIYNSLVHKISTKLRNNVLTKGLTEDGSPRYIISEAALEKVYDSLCERLQHFHSNHAVLKRCLVADEDRCDIFPFSCLAIRS